MVKACLQQMEGLLAILKKKVMEDHKLVNVAANAKSK